MQVSAYRRDSEDADYERFCVFLEDSCGISLSGDKGYLVDSRLGALMRELGCASLGALVDRVQRTADLCASRRLRGRIIDAMTTNETLWFRDDHPFIVLKEVIFAQMHRQRRRPRIWSAACSTGQEPYSIAISADEFCREHPHSPLESLEIVATDVSPRVLAVAAQGLYPRHQLGRGLSEARVQRYFERQGDRGWRLREPWRNRVEFRELNLLASFLLLGRFDVIFCRNVLIYFSASRRIDILSRMRDALLPGGWLILGGSETLPPEVSGLERVRLSKSVAYRRPG